MRESSIGFLASVIPFVAGYVSCGFHSARSVRDGDACVERKISKKSSVSVNMLTNEPLMVNRK